MPETFKLARFNLGRVATAASTLLLWAGAADVMAQAPANPVPGAAPLACPIDYLNGPNAACDPTSIPPGCVANATPAQRKFIKYNPYMEKRGKELADEAESSAVRPIVVDHVRRGFQDDGAIVNDWSGLAGVTLLLGRINGDNWLRITVNPRDFIDSRGRQLPDTKAANGIEAPPWSIQKYDLAVERAKVCGYHIQMTLACNREHWSVQKFRNYNYLVASRYNDKVDWYGVCNEPNGKGGWLPEMPHKNEVQTYCTLYPAGYDTIKAVNPDNKVVFGEVASAGQGNKNTRPVVFTNQVVDCINRTTGAPAKMDYDGIHPYRWYKKGLKEVPSQNKQLKPTAKTVGIDSLDTYIVDIDKLYAEHKIETEDGQKPGIDISEYGVKVNARGRDRVHNVTEKFRAELLPRVADAVCTRKDVDAFFSYQMVEQPKSWKGEWSTALVSQNGLLKYSFWSLRAAFQKYGPCVKQ